MKRNKRYTTEAQIIAVIDRERQRAIDMLSEAESLEATARELIKIPEMVEDAGFKRDEARALRKASARIIDTKLPKLGAKLAELKTAPLINLDGRDGIGDESASVKLK